MRFVAILGAGELGAGIARTLASRGRVAEVRLIDEASAVAAGKALDIQQAAPIEHSATRVVASSDLTAAVGAAAVLLADRVGSEEYSGEAGLALVKRLASIDPRGVIVCAGGDQHTVLAHGLHELHLSRARLFGSAPEAVVSALRAMVAIEADVSPSAVSLTVLGTIPTRVVVPWSDATIAGRPLARVLGPPQLARIERRSAALRALGPYALAAAAARLAEMLVAGSRRVVCCTVGLDGELGLRRALSAMPVLVGPGGLLRVISPPLDVREQVLLENAVTNSVTSDK
jgi:malate/lactate dehydrogenase